MTCACQKHPDAAPVHSDCRFCTPTSVWWAPHKSCLVNRCANVDKMLTDPPEWAYGNTRKATVGDSPKGAVLEDADYIAVRSCFCRCGKCPHFTPNEEDSAETPSTP